MSSTDGRAERRRASSSSPTDTASTRSATRASPSGSYPKAPTSTCPTTTGTGAPTARAVLDDLEATVEDLHRTVARARAANPDLPVALLGHSMGGLIAARFAQLHGDELAALVLSGPAVGGNPQLAALLEMDPIPQVPIDPEALSRDPAVGEAYANDPLVYHGRLRARRWKDSPPASRR